MDRRRASRPASSEEMQCWSHVSTSLVELSNKYATQESVETISRTNRLIAGWPQDDTLPAEGFDSVKKVYKKLSSSLMDIKQTSELEAKALDDTIEQLGVLIALRSAPETLSQEKRKRPRGLSPASASPAPTGGRNGAISLTISARNSAAPTPAPAKQAMKAGGIARHLPLEKGRKVAFRPPTKEGEETNWILAVVTKYIDKHKYEVVDAEPQDGPPQPYMTTVRALIPLPDPGAAPGSQAHPSTYPEFKAGATVMALYPDTSCFYRAEVLEPPGRSSRNVQAYKLRFEDDDNLEHTVPAHLVIDWPGGT